MATVKAVEGRLSRRERAHRTRARILDAAFHLFSTQGYEATTMQDVADAAGVAVQTVYLGFRTKGQLLAEVEDRAILGGQPTERLREQPWFVDMAREGDPSRVVELLVLASSEIVGRIAAFVALTGSGMRMDPATIAARERGHEEFLRGFIERLHALEALRPELTPARAIDIVRVTMTLEGYVDLTQRRGWSPDQWRELMRRVVSHAILRPAAVPRSGSGRKHPGSAEETDRRQQEHRQQRQQMRE